MIASLVSRWPTRRDTEASRGPVQTAAGLWRNSIDGEAGVDAADRWKRTWEHLDVAPPCGVVAELIAAYREPDRAYHTLQHLSERFDEYEGQIRQEFSWVPDAAYRSARARILAQFLDRPVLYHTAHFRDRLENQARANLSRSLNALAG